MNKHIKMFQSFHSEAEFEIGDIVRIEPNNDNDNYDDFRDKDLKIVRIATSKEHHPGYDESMEGQGLYDLEVVGSGEDVPFSLYDYELVEK